MVEEALHQKQVPWCTVFLVMGAVVCHSLVLIGNCMTANSMNTLGLSTGGWAKVGIGVARSLQLELDHEMKEVSTMLVDGLGHLGIVQDSLDTLVSLIDANGTEIIDQPSQLSSLPTKALSLLQQHQAAVDPNAFAGLALVIGEAVHRTVMATLTRIAILLDKFLEVIRPALVRIGQWLVRFGARIQSGIGVFSITLDRVQKLFDQIMSQLAGPGDNEEGMLDQTFGLFDVSNTGYVTAEDLKEVANLYRITALEGDVPRELVEKYDASDDGKLSKEELALLVNDAKLPNLMSAVLRTYAKRLAEISGVVATARHRDEVAQAVVDYLALVCSRNATKVGWVSDRLANGSLPLEFTADIMAQLCLSEESPDRLTTTSVGRIVTEAMYSLHPENTLRAVDFMSNTSFWVSEGFNIDDQPLCVKRVLSWIANSSHMQGTAPDSTELETAEDKRSMFEKLRSARNTPLSGAFLKALPERAEALTRESVASYLLERRGLSQMLPQQQRSSRNLAHGMPDVAPSAREQAVGSGQPAAPETLEFTQWLANNASRTANMMHDMCFVYSSESSNALDSFGAQIQTMVGRVQAVLDSMMKYATPEGIERLETQIETFEEKAMAQIAERLERRLLTLLNSSLPKLGLEIKTAVHSAGEHLGHAVGGFIESPLGRVLKDPVSWYLGRVMDSEKAGRLIGEVFGPKLAGVVANLTSDTIASATGNVLEGLVERVLERGLDIVNSTGGRVVDSIIKEVDHLIPGLAASHGSQRGYTPTSARLASSGTQDETEKWLAVTELRSKTSRSRRVSSASQTIQEETQSQHGVLEAMKSKYAITFQADGVGEVWEALVHTIKTLSNLLPASIRTVKKARLEVSKLSSNLVSIFSVFDDRGKQLFNTVARFWRALWVLYFCALVPLNGYILYYGFWAGGFFGGPMPLTQDQERSAEPPKTFRERLALCFESCSLCMKQYHDTQLCFWSVILLLQVVVLIIFVVSIGLCAMAGIKAFILAGCSQLYVLGDENVCKEQLSTIREFLSTFFIEDAMEPLSSACGGHKLLTCHLIRQKIVASSILTSVFSFLGALFCMQLVVDSAMIHEQARWRRLAAALMRMEKGDTSPALASASAP